MQPRLCIFLPYYDNGGVERMLVNLAQGFVACGQAVDFVVCNINKPYLTELPQDAQLIELNARNRKDVLFKTKEYLLRAQPSIILTAKEPDAGLAAKAVRETKIACNLFIRAVTNHSQRLAFSNPIKRWLELRTIRQIYRAADGIIAVSNGVADDLVQILGHEHPPIVTANNPVVTRRLFKKCDEDISHPWLNNSIPIVLGIGRFSRAKNFPLLIKAFSLVRRHRPCRLIILGSGRQYAKLLHMAKSLNISDDISFPGYIENPYPYLKHAAVFVLTSLWEGSPNVLTEALALGCPVVSTDCPSGPREILQDGKFGALVPVDDAEALAKAIIQTMENPLDKAILQSAALSFTAEASAKQYLAAMGLLIRHE